MCQAPVSGPSRQHADLSSTVTITRCNSIRHGLEFLKILNLGTANPDHAEV
jgi:hypothetical protein